MPTEIVTQHNNENSHEVCPLEAELEKLRAKCERKRKRIKDLKNHKPKNIIIEKPIEIEKIITREIEVCNCVHEEV